MKRRIVYSLLIFFCLFAEINSQPITDSVMGYRRQIDLRSELLFGTLMAAFGTVVFSWPFFLSKQMGAVYRPGRLFAGVAALLVAISTIIGVVGSMVHGPEKVQAQLVLDRAAKVTEEQREKEQQRQEALTPGQRAAEADKKQKAAMAVAAKIAEAESNRRAAEKKELDANTAEALCQMQVKKQAHDPSSLSWILEERRFGYTSPDKTKAKLVEPMRAKNAMGALTLGAIECNLVQKNGNWYVVRVTELK